MRMNHRSNLQVGLLNPVIHLKNNFLVDKNIRRRLAFTNNSRGMQPNPLRSGRAFGIIPNRLSARLRSLFNVLRDNFLNPAVTLYASRIQINRLAKLAAPPSPYCG